mmetsp:Transcript_10272/g.23724  ORF Transcript_10272/g.23724 Transcript_10272/m.23724 type:complete len:202 (-) Transcript_10272:415-1020(-)
MKTIILDALNLGTFNWQQTVSAFWMLFAVLDVLGSVPLFVNMKERVGHINPYQITVASSVIMLSFLLLGQSLLNVFSIDGASFSVAGSLILLILGLEMILNVHIFHIDVKDRSAVSIVPLAFPIVSGTGTLTTLLALKKDYAVINILCGILPNIIFIYFVIKHSDYVAKLLGRSGTTIVQKIMGIIVLAIAIRILRTNIFL